MTNKTTSSRNPTNTNSRAPTTATTAVRYSRLLTQTLTSHLSYHSDIRNTHTVVASDKSVTSASAVTRVSRYDIKISDTDELLVYFRTHVTWANTQSLCLISSFYGCN